jgi:hypothetical protein
MKEHQVKALVKLAELEGYNAYSDEEAPKWMVSNSYQAVLNEAYSVSGPVQQAYLRGWMSRSAHPDRIRAARPV